MSTNGICYEGCFVYRNAAVNHVRTVLKEKHPNDWKDVLTRITDWDTIVANANEPRDTGKLGAIVKDEFDYLSVNHLYNLFEKYFDELFPPNGGGTPNKKRKSAILVWAKEIKDLRDPLAHPAEEPFDYEDAFRQLDSARRICINFDTDAAEQISELIRKLNNEPQIDNEPLNEPIEARLPPRETIVSNFVGRQHELEDLKDWVRDSNSKIKLLAGDGGKGKSAIAYEFATRVQREAPSPLEFVIWLSAKRKKFVEGQTTDIDSPDFWDFESALDRVLDEYGSLDKDSISIEEKKREALDFFQQLPALVIIDDVNSLEGDLANTVSWFLWEAAKTPSKFLLTSRLVPFGMDTWTTQISGFIPGGKDGLRFVQSRINLFGLDPEAFPKRVIDEILRVTDGSPLYVEDLLRLAQLGDSISKVCKDWSERRGQPAREYALGRELDILSNHARTVLITVAVLNKPASTPEITAAVGHGFDEYRVREAVGELQKLFLLPKPRITEDVPRVSISQNTRELVLDVAKKNNPDLLKRIESAVHQITGRTRGNARVGTYIRQATSQVKLQQFIDAEETLKQGLEAIPESADIYGHLGWVYTKWLPSPRVTDARENFRRASDLKCTKADMYYHWCRLEWKNREWSRMAEAATTGLNILESNLDLEYSAGEAYSRMAYDMFSQDQMSIATREAQSALIHIANVLRVDIENLEQGQYILHGKAYNVRALTLNTMIRIAKVRGDDYDVQRKLQSLANTLNEWQAEHPMDSDYSYHRDNYLQYYPNLANLLKSNS